MKKILCILCLAASALLAGGHASYSKEYDIKQLSDSTDGLNNQYHQLNANGQVVWQKWTTSWSEVFLYDGVSADPINISNAASEESGPQINSNGQIVWSAWDGVDGEIFLYNGGSPINISNNPYSNDSSPQINDNGNVVWSGYDGTDEEIFFYDSAANSVNQLTNDAAGGYDDRHPQISSNGHIVWMRQEGPSADWEIFLYDGENIINISNNDYNDGYPRISATGEVVWASHDGVDSEIFLFDGVGATQLTNNNYDDLSPEINRHGHIVWHSAGEEVFSQIFFYDGSIISQITNNTTGVSNDSPQINSNDEVVWRGGGELFVYDGINTTQLTNDGFSDQDAKINDNGQIAWMKSVVIDNFMRPQIFLATPVAAEIPVTIDIKPESDTNTINLSSSGVVPVAILSSSTFDATEVDPDSVSLAGARVKMVGKSNRFLCHEQDVDSDGLADLLCQVETAQFMIEVGDSIAVLEAANYGGDQIRGEDKIRIVPDN